MKHNNFLIPLLEEFSPDKIDIVSNDIKILEGIKGAFGSPGGKFFVAGKLVAMFPEHDRYIEPFIGGGSVLFRKKKTENEFINDKDAEIIFCYRFMQDLTEQQLEALNKMDWKTSKETFNRLLAAYKESPDEKDAIQKFYRHVYLKCASDSGEMRSYDDRAEGEVMKVTERLMKIKERLYGVTIENMDYKDFIKKHATESSFTFLDPPYPSARMNWKWCPTQEEFESFTKTIPGKWMITYEVCDGWKEAKYNRKILSQYNLSAPSEGHMTRKSELIIANYPLKQYNAYLSEAHIDIRDINDAAEFISCVDLSRLRESRDLESDLREILKLYADKRRGEDIKQTFEQIKTAFKNAITKMIKSGITDFQPDKLSPFAKELFDKYTEYRYLVPQPDGTVNTFNSLKELKDSGIDYRGYKLEIKMKEADKKIGNFALYHQWWKNKNLTESKIESFIIATDLHMDLILDANPMSETFKEAVFYIKPAKYTVMPVNESVTFVAPRDTLNMTEMPCWVKVIESGKISVLESTAIEKTIEFSGNKLKGIFTAKRENENSDFWVLQKNT